MAGNRRRTRRQEAAENRAKYIRIGVILGILAAVAVLIFIFANLGKGEETAASPDNSPGMQLSQDTAGEAESESGTAAGGESGSSVAPDNNQYITDFSQYELQKDAVPQVNQLISDYFQAKVDQDAVRLYALFGKTEDDRLPERQEELENEAVWVEDYQNITCYTKQGLTQDSYVVYVTYEVKFRRVDTPAPGLMWCYVVKREDGKYIIRENVVGEEADYVAAQNQTEDVLLLSKQVNERLRQAIESDSLLAGRYNELRNGAVVTESTEASGQDSEIQLIDENGGETSAGESSSAETASPGETGGGETAAAGESSSAPSAAENSDAASAPDGSTESAVSGSETASSAGNGADTVIELE